MTIIGRDKNDDPLSQIELTRTTVILSTESKRTIQSTDIHVDLLVAYKMILDQQKIYKI